jgi:hypothetical protein
VGHTSLESDEGGKMGLFGRIVFGEGPYAAAMMAGSSLGKETEVSSSRSFEFSM